MTDVRGLKLELAEEILASEGISVVTEEVRSRKGVADGDEKRVIRVRRAGDKVCLAYSVFKTKV